MLEVKNLSVSYSGLRIVDDVNFSVGENQWLMLVGPNGAGKSTILNAISQGTAYTGGVFWKGEDVRRMKPVVRARNIGYLSQMHMVTYSFTVGEVVRLGRYAHSAGMFSRGDAEDEQRVKSALQQTGMLAHEHQSVLQLSGGELQRTFLAQVLAQDPALLILDEPANHLDLVYQKQVFGLVKDWLKQPGRCVISVVHDLSLARAYGTEILLLHRGKTVSTGTVQEVFTQENLQQVYAMDVHGWMRKMLEQW